MCTIPLIAFLIGVTTILTVVVGLHLDKRNKNHGKD